MMWFNFEPCYPIDSNLALLFANSILNSLDLTNEPCSSALIILTARAIAFRVLNTHCGTSNGGQLFQLKKEKENRVDKQTMFKIDFHPQTLATSQNKKSMQARESGGHICSSTESGRHDSILC